MDDAQLTRILGGGLGLPSSHIKEITRVVMNLPWLEVTVAIEGSTERHGRWQVDAGKDYELKIRMKRSRALTSKESDLRVYAPQFPKPQMESWFVLLGDETSDELMALKRVSSSSSSRSELRHSGSLATSLKFKAPLILGDGGFTVSILSDSVLGVDEKMNVNLWVSEKRLD